MPDSKIGRSMDKMRAASDGRVVGDHKEMLQTIASRAGADFDLVRAVFRRVSLPARSDNAELQKLLTYLLSGAAAAYTAPEHHRTLVENAADLARRIDARRDDEGRRADSLQARPLRALAPDAAAPAASPSDALPPPAAGRSSSALAQDGVAMARRTLDMAAQWRALREGEYAAAPAGSAEAGAAWLRATVEEGNQHIVALRRISKEVRGPAGSNVRIASIRALRECEQAVALFAKRLEKL